MTVSRSTRSRTRTQLSKAEIKAYEARRAAEAQRIGAAPIGAAGTQPPMAAHVRRSYTLSRDEEFAIIRSDLRRLLMIVALLAVVLIAATFVLR